MRKIRVKSTVKINDRVKSVASPFYSILCRNVFLSEIRIYVIFNSCAEYVA